MSEDTSQKSVGEYKPTDEEAKTIKKWQDRFKQSKNFRDPYLKKMLRMWKLYRAYRDKENYAYNTNLMPPIGFEIVETIKPRLSAAKMRTRIFPVSKDDVESGAIEEWDNLMAYDFEVMDLHEKKVDWIDAMLKFGNGYAQVYWEDNEDGGDPGLDINDNFLIYFDPNSGPRLKDSEWEIKRTFKTKSRINKEEKKRDVREETDEETGEPVVDEETGEIKKVHGVYKNLEFVKDEKISEDPRAERLEIETLKMGQIDSSTATRESDDTQIANSDSSVDTKVVDIWECFDHDTDEIITIMNQKVLVRQEPNPYVDIEEGRMIIDLPCIRVPWSAYSMAIMEPVETIIHEIADSRNQAMDSVVFNLDPIKKVKKDSGITSDDIVTGPGAMWELENVDDVVIERGEAPNNSWVEKDNLLRREIQSSLAMSEYVRGLPASPDEPNSKIETLLQQTQIRFSQMVRQLEVAMTDIVNILIQMNQKFLTEDKTYRIIGDDVDFKTFTDQSKEVRVDARVELEPKPEIGPEQRKKEAIELYEIFVTEDQPSEGDEEGMKKWKSKKREMQKMILDAYDKSQYEEVLLGLEKLEQAEQDKNQTNEQAVDSEAEVETPEQVVPKQTLAPIAPINPEGAAVAPVGASPIPNSQAPGGSPPGNLLARLLGRIRR